MAFFKFRLPGFKADADSAPLAPAESIEGLRRRARHRLIGAAVLVLVAVIGFPLVFDTQPRPVAVDVAIQIPDRNKVKPLAPPSVAPEPTASAAGAVLPASAPTPAASSAVQVPARASLDAREEIVGTVSEKKADKPSVKGPEAAINSEAKHEAPAAPKSDPKPEPKADAKPEPKPEARPPAKPADDGSRARALLEGKETPTPPTAAASETGRFIVQVGAFADVAKARETRLKVEKAGLTTYTQVVETGEGKRIRVRVGPFSNRAEADKAAARIRGLDLPAAILTL